MRDEIREAGAFLMIFGGGVQPATEGTI